METAIRATRRRPSFEELYAAHGPDARRVAYLLVGDRVQAEDVAQEAFVRVLGRFGDLRKPEAFRTYLMRTVVSLSKNHFRRRSLERRHAHAGRPPMPDAPERDDDLFDALKKLPERQRAALVLRYCEDLSEHQTAEILNTSTKAVKSLVTRGLAAMREEVAR
ncbi:MAG TPA: SigE family RNA polymerase sigma factor [Actinomycetota bacterium]|nr:SigE family RNA polymerase sigma factor [Actinomycetota bacterium]